MAARGYGDIDIARVLSAQRRRTGKGNAWTAISVSTARRNYEIAGRKLSALPNNILSQTRAAEYCGVSNTAIKSLVRLGILPCSGVAPGAPWEIRTEDLDSKPVQDAIANLRKTGTLTVAGTAPTQQTLELE